MRIFVLPVSGGAFPCQLGLISELLTSGIGKPDLVMGSSGGNVAGYMSLAGEWNPDKIVEIAKKTHSGMFAQSWWPSYLQFLPSYLIGYFKGSLYSNGSGIEELFRTYFTSESIQTTEIWTGTLNRGTGKGQFFCNRSQEESLIQPLTQETYPTLFSRDCMPLTYLNGDVNKIASVTIASASIPVLVPEKIIDGQHYVDGGTLFASPITALSDHVIEMSIRRNCSLSIDYINSYDISANVTNSYRSLYENSTLLLGELVRSICIQDRLSAIELLRLPDKNSCGMLHYTEMEGTGDNLKQIEKIRQFCSRSVLELYPVFHETLNLLNFNGRNVCDLLEATRKSYRLRFWWSSPSIDKDTIVSLPTYKCLKLSRIFSSGK